MWKLVQTGLSVVAGTAEPEYGPDSIHPVGYDLKENEPIYSGLTEKDMCYISPSHTNVETQTFYFNDEIYYGFAQIIHSNVIPLTTTAQFTFKIYNKKTPQDYIWTSTKLDNFRTDGTNFHADNLDIILDLTTMTYEIKSFVNKETLVDLKFKRLGDGIKFGKDGTTYYGTDINEPWGSMRHIFWPRCVIEGTVTLTRHKSHNNDTYEQSMEPSNSTESQTQDDDNKTLRNGKEEKEFRKIHHLLSNAGRKTLGKLNNLSHGNGSSSSVNTIESTNSSIDNNNSIFSIFNSKEKSKTLKFNGLGMYVMALQGMKPHHAAATWNFLNYNSDNYSVVIMEFTTPKSYHYTKVSVGMVVNAKGEVISASMNDDNKTIHLDSEIDEIGWPIPHKIEFILNGENSKNEKISTKCYGDLIKLSERVDVMAEIPQFVKNIVSGVAGTKPYIYQFSNEFNLEINLPNGEVIKETGLGYNEATFISAIKKD
ncbi:unnamed protein product [[Candida] boidinii]|uniref:Unnamed protein product n=1 Tax=Candida boidinii TaxID=5477 RepID=A0A9W6T3W4_CANBO|nr:hypothetical protein B5S30_g5687 [[Candida] boidinii]OWB85866.1 hypothetical protein B5S33_g4540 [[Candida] boidinii]GME73848.1 unnamed protein product [[Candida] boidinii]GMG05040.1 unnamed protein product [[Candida] boidinii]